MVCLDSLFSIVLHSSVVATFNRPFTRSNAYSKVTLRDRCPTLFLRWDSRPLSSCRSPTRTTLPLLGLSWKHHFIFHSRIFADPSFKITSYLDVFMYCHIEYVCLAHKLLLAISLATQVDFLYQGTTQISLSRAKTYNKCLINHLYLQCFDVMPQRCMIHLLSEHLFILFCSW